MPSVVIRPQAEEDLTDAAAHYHHAAGIDLATRMVDAALETLDLIADQPMIGSPRLGQLCEIPGLRSWRVKGFPMQWFYLPRDGMIDVVRLLGDRQDIVAILRVDDKP